MTNKLKIIIFIILPTIVAPNQDWREITKCLISCTDNAKLGINKK